MINYFVHDTFSHNDEKLESVLFSNKAGLKGYGLYWLLLELLAGTPDGKLKLDYNYLGRKCNSDASADLVKTVINDFGLFEIVEDGKYFRSKRLSQTIEDVHNVSERRRIAGLKSGESRKKSVLCSLSTEQKSDNSSTNVKQEPNNNSTNIQQVLNKCSANVEQVLNKCSANVEQVLNKCSTNVEQRKEEKSKEDNSITPLNPPKGEKVEEILLPPTLDFPEFKSAWKDWVAYRKEKRQPLKASTVKGQIKFLAEHPAEAVEMIQQSIRNGWQGLFELKDYTKALRQPVMTNNQELDVYKHFLEGGK